jgi:phage tail protein X
LKTYVDRNWPPASLAQQAKEALEFPDRAWGIKDPREGIRHLLARRIARETGSAEAAAYYPTNLSDAYKTFLDELHTGRNEALQPGYRAKNLYAAAILERTNGMELFGSELEPDWEIWGGNFEFGFTWEIRATNSLVAKVNDMSDDEIARASSRRVDPDRRFHYRWQAAALAWEAAQLMPNNTDETARALCTAGTWLKDRDPQGADKFYKALVRRCRKTALGEQADKLRWFPAQPIDGTLPRLETIEITPELTNSASGQRGDIYSDEFPVPGRKYVVHEDEDVYVIARAVQRLGCAISVEDILKANPGLKRGPLPFGIIITIPEASGGTENSPR